MKEPLLILLLPLLLLSCSRSSIEPNAMSQMPLPSGEPDECNFTAHMRLVTDNVIKLYRIFYPEIYNSIVTGNTNIDVDCFTEQDLQRVYPRYNPLNNDTLIYILNLSNDRGFAIYDRLGGVMALTGSGNIPISMFHEPVNSDNFGSFDPRITLTALVEMRALYIGLIPERGIEPPLRQNEIELIGEPELINHVGPFIATKMKQESPYNWSCISNNDTLVKAGCAAIALTQLFAYHGSPELVGTINAISCDWPSFITAANDFYATERIDTVVMSKLAEVIHKIGRQCGIRYRRGLSGSTIERMTNCINYYGADYCDVDFQDFSEASYSRCISYFDRSMPIVATGVDSVNGVGHAWLLDGYGLVRQSCIWHEIYTDFRFDPFDYYYYFFHCNWGWGGLCDGYFNPDFSDLTKYDVNHRAIMDAPGLSANHCFMYENRVIYYNLTH